MNSEEFIQTCSSMGYSTKKLAKKYVEKNQKDTYDMDDIINVHRKSGNFKGNHTCGLSNIPTFLNSRQPFNLLSSILKRCRFPVWNIA